MAPTRAVPLAERGHVVLHGISWETYEALLHEEGMRNLRLTYDKGELEIMSPLPRHERINRLIGRMVETMALEMDIPIASYGSTTFKRKALGQGLEPDECHYVQRAEKARDPDKLDVGWDVPDLVVEVDITSRSIERQPIYAALGVPELWRFDGARIESLHLASGHYRRRQRSRAFPFLRMADVQRFLSRFPGADEHTVLRAWRDFVRVLPRGPK